MITRKAGDLILGFLDDRFEGTLSEFTIRQFKTEVMENKKGKNTSRLVAEPGDLIAH